MADYPPCPIKGDKYNLKFPESDGTKELHYTGYEDFFNGRWFNFAKLGETETWMQIRLDEIDQLLDRVEADK